MTSGTPRQGAGAGDAGDGGTADRDTGTVHLPDVTWVGPDLTLPEPPDDLAYTDLADWRARTLLDRHGIGVDAAGLRDALATQDGPLLGAAAHAAAGFDELGEALRGLLPHPDDAVGVEAAHALARQGDAAGVDALRDALARPVGPYLSPLTAAGYLARLGDAAGYPLVRDGLGTDERAVDARAVTMLAAKQVLFFLPLDGHAAAGTTVDAAGLVARALAHPDPAIGEQVRAELERSPLPLAARLLADARG